MSKAQSILEFILAACFEDDGHPEEFFEDLEISDRLNQWKEVKVPLINAKVYMVFRWQKDLKDCRIGLLGEPFSRPLIMLPSDFLFFLGFWVQNTDKVIRWWSAHKYEGEEDLDDFVLIGETKLTSEDL